MLFKRFRFCVSCHAAAVPGNSLDNSDILKALSKAVASSVGKPEQVTTRAAATVHVILTINIVTVKG